MILNAQISAQNHKYEQLKQDTSSRGQHHYRNNLPRKSF